MSLRLERAAAEMEAAIINRRGWDYVTHSKHGRLPRWTPCRVYRTDYLTLIVWVENRHLPEVLRNSSVDGYERRFEYTQRCWYVKGYESLLTMIPKLDHYTKLKPL